MKKFLIFMLAMLWMSVAAFSQITISQEDYDKLPSDTRTQIEKITTEKAIKGEIKEVSEYANLGKEIGVAVNETLKAVEDSAGIVVGTILLGISVFMLLTGRGKLSKNDEDAGGWISVVGGAVFFISSMVCIFGWGAIQAIGWYILAIFCALLLLGMILSQS